MVSKTWMRALAAACLAVLVATPSLMAQSEESDQYRIEYTAYTDARETQGHKEKAKALIGFMDQFPESSLVEHAQADYRQVLAEVLQARDDAMLLELSRDLLGFYERMREKAAELPSDRSEELKKRYAEDLAPLYYSADVLFRQQDYAKCFPYAERVYRHEAASDDFKNKAAYMIAYGAVQAGDEARLNKFGDHVIKTFGPQETYFMIVELMREHYTAQRLSQAAGYAQQAIGALNAIKSTTNGELGEYVAKNLTMAYAILGHERFEREDWRKAIGWFEKVIQSTRDKAFVGESYYKIGMANWRTNLVDPEAMYAFARGYKWGAGQHSKACFKHLEDLYKARHNGSSAGLDEYIERATS